MTVQWIELVVEVPYDDAERWADACLEAGALSVQAEDADADSPDEQPRFGEPAPDGSSLPGPAFGWQRTRLTVMVSAEAASAAGAATGFEPTALVEPTAVLDAAAAVLGRPTPPVLERRPIEDRDWVRATQSQFEPIPIGERLIIVPSWHRDAAATRHPSRQALIIDPGLAFGTGGHPTTRMCLEWLDQADLRGRRVIDYGCGSGILAIAAARLGAAPVLGIDIDPQALASAGDNAAQNGVRIEVRSSADARPAPADVVLANILSNPLKLLAPLLGRLVAPGGFLVLAGVLDRQADEVAAAYDPALGVRVWRSLDGWSCLVGRRAAS